MAISNDWSVHGIFLGPNNGFRHTPDPVSIGKRIVVCAFIAFNQLIQHGAIVYRLQWRIYDSHSGSLFTAFKQFMAFPRIITIDAVGCGEFLAIWMEIPVKVIIWTMLRLSSDSDIGIPIQLIM
jgi:hypothetical protein